jgi:hypothetical protein
MQIPVSYMMRTPSSPIIPACIMILIADDQFDVKASAAGNVNALSTGVRLLNRTGS